MKAWAWGTVAVIGCLVGACTPTEGVPNEGQASSSEGGSDGDTTIGSGATGSTTQGGSTSVGSSTTSTDSTTGTGVDTTSGPSDDTGDTEIAGGCDRSVALANRAVVGMAIDELFVDKDLGAIDRYWSEPYLQHNPAAQSGVEAFRTIMSSFVPSPAFMYQRVRTLADCDLVVVQGDYQGQGVIFDMFRVADGQIIEHWDSDAGQGSDPSGPTEVVDGDPAEANREVVLDFIDRVLVDGQTDQASAFFDAAYVEHHAAQATGSAAFLEYVAGDAIGYVAVRQAIADGNFVFTLSEGQTNGTPFAFYDLFRVQGGLLVEHWDARRVVPANTQSGLGIF